ncbi:hypothetical protein EVAR_74809_1 [Eumeta japonica]|uniref:Uncharacterized protein n=1 Tax=Eumeta variegata TaxID=151549 RepID=A0A4C1SS80_EUMVA|nr:hypothetical protein EVAR_74809_1 [Eumeta japonica]
MKNGLPTTKTCEKDHGQKVVLGFTEKCGSSKMGAQRTILAPFENISMKSFPEGGSDGLVQSRGRAVHRT